MRCLLGKTRTHCDGTVLSSGTVPNLCRHAQAPPFDAQAGGLETIENDNKLTGSPVSTDRRLAVDVSCVQGNRPPQCQFGAVCRQSISQFYESQSGADEYHGPCVKNSRLHAMKTRDLEQT